MRSNGSGRNPLKAGVDFSLFPIAKKKRFRHLARTMQLKRIKPSVRSLVSGETGESQSVLAQPVRILQTRRIARHT